MALVRNFDDPRIQLHVNACNVGFAGNLDRSARMATGELMIMLSSDDLMRPGALAAYRKLFAHLGPAGRSRDRQRQLGRDRLGRPRHGRNRTRSELVDRGRSQRRAREAAGRAGLRRRADELLRRCLRQMKNPFNFAATVYATRALPRASRATAAVGFIIPTSGSTGRCWARPTWPTSSTAAVRLSLARRQPVGPGRRDQRAQVPGRRVRLDAGAGRRACSERIGLSRDDVLEAFVEYDIARHGLATLAQGQRVRARRILDFGRAAYPQHVRRNRHARALGAAVVAGTESAQMLAARAYRSYRDRKTASRKRDEC